MIFWKSHDMFESNYICISMHLQNISNLPCQFPSSIFYFCFRAATIQAETAGHLWAMDRQTFRRILLKSAFKKRKMYESLLDNVPMLKALQVSSLFALHTMTVTAKFHVNIVLPFTMLLNQVLPHSVRVK